MNQRAISRAALSAPSEAWTRLRPTSTPRSPRTVPGSALAGFVAPFVLRTVAIAPGPSKDRHDNGRRGDKGDEPLKEALALMLRVVLLGERTIHHNHLARDQLQPAPLQPPDNLPNQPALHRVRLRDHQRLLNLRHTFLLESIIQFHRGHHT